MPYLDNRVYDNGLGIFATECNALRVCTAEPTNFTQANTTYAIGSKASPTCSAPQVGAPNGRQVTVSAINDGTVTGNGTASHWALIDTTNSRLLAAGSLGATQVFTAGNEFKLSSFTVRIPGIA